MSHKESVLSFFPGSIATKASNGEEYVVTVPGDNGKILIAESGKTAQEAWRNVYIRIYQIWSPAVGVSEAAKLLVNANQGEVNGVHQRTMGCGKT